ncbi:MAG: hypothetical protein RIA64_01535 [Rhodospirillales bacterium]
MAKEVLHSDLGGDLDAAFAAADDIVIVSTRHGDHRHGGFTFNPATGALKTAPAYRDKMEKAIFREVGLMKQGLRLRKARLKIDMILLKGRAALLKARQMALGLLFQNLKHGTPR